MANFQNVLEWQKYYAQAKAPYIHLKGATMVEAWAQIGA